MHAKQPARDYGKGRLLLPNEAAERLRLDPKAVGRWARAGLLPSVMLPSGHRRFWESDVEEVINEGYRPRTHSPTKAVANALLGQLELPGLGQADDDEQ